MKFLKILYLKKYYNNKSWFEIIVFEQKELTSTHFYLCMWLNKIMKIFTLSCLKNSNYISNKRAKLEKILELF